MVDCNGHSDSEFHKGGRNAGGAFAPKGKDVNMRRVLPRWLTVLVMLEASYSITGSDVEGDALFKFLRALNDSYRPTTDWNLNIVSPCFSWSHVVCKDGHVVSLNLASNGFSGTFSPSITKLKFLLSLDLQDNNVSGVLPDYLSNLTQLQYLNLGRNNFNGSIPTTWDRLPNLKHLDLSFNNLTGRIPRQLFLIPTYNFTGTHLACGSSVQKPCVSSSSLAVPTRQKKLGTFPIVACCGALALLLLGVIFICINRHDLKSEKDLFFDVEGEDELNISLGQLRRFSLREVQLATDNFNDNNVIGQGGFGKVYRGILPDQTMVAVKRLRDYHSLGGEAAFLREVQLISVAVHRNLLQLIGSCTTSSERILVYPFMRNLSVANHLRDLKPGDKTLDWATRKRVAFGAARGLEYLHEHCNPKIIHRDLKAANILLDDDFEAVLGDFGLAKLVDANMTHITTQVRGTMGHIAPEYLSTGKSSEKTDVFGYGVTLLELITGQRAVDFARLDEEDDVLLLDHMKKLEREKRLNDMVDRNLETYDLKEVETVIQIALLCTQSLPEQRPTMAEVVSLLGGVGLAERWSRWEQLDEARTQVHSSTAASHQFAWPDDHSTNLQEAMQLSRPR